MGKRKAGHWGAPASTAVAERRPLAELEAEGKPPSITLTGRVARVFFSSPEFTAGRLVTDDSESYPFAGKCYAEEGQRVALTGRWENSKYGRQLKVERMEFDLSLTETGLANWLADHPDIHGIGPAKARAIAERFHDDWENALVGRAEEIAAVARVPLDVIENLRHVWSVARVLNAVAAELAAYELTHHQITTLIDKYGSGVLGVLKADPYVLIGAVRNYGFKRVDAIARKLGTPKNHPGRLRAGLAWLVNNAANHGHTWIDWNELKRQALEVLILDTLDAEAQIEDALNTLLMQHESIALVDLGDGRQAVAPSKLQAAEEWIACLFADVAKRENPHRACLSDSAIDECALELNDAQRNALYAATRYQMSVITGGAGTGKTFTTNQIIRAFESAGRRVVLCAPTGKAAKRMEESTGRPASTIHRLLGLGKGQTERDAESEPIDADVLIVDEVSMIDVPLFYALASAVNWRRTSAVLVGDPNQLPPIGPGNVLRDLLRGAMAPTTALTRCMRQAGILKTNASAVLGGAVAPSSDRAPEHPYRPWFVIDSLETAADVADCIVHMHRAVLRPKWGFHPLRDVQVLTPQKKGPAGTDALNRTLQAWAQAERGNPVDRCPDDRRPKLYPGDKVIQTRNNYAMGKNGVMNGAVGYVIDADRAGDLVIDFDGEEVAVGADDAGDVQLAYALTIHKSQGSEFPCVMVVCHSTHAFMHHRNLLYTAVTRSRACTVLLGDKKGIARCARKQQVDERRTLLPHYFHQTQA